MTSGSTLWRRRALLIAIVSPVLLGTEWKCTGVSNPAVVTAHIRQVEPESPRAGDVVEATGHGEGIPPLQYAWDFGDGAVFAGPRAAHVYIAAGNYLLRLTVRDASGGIGRDERAIVVSARQSSDLAVAPILKAIAGQPVVFEVLPFDAGIDADYVWTFDGGQSALGPSVTATFHIEGKYAASVSAISRSGEISVAHVEFDVSAPAP